MDYSIKSTGFGSFYLIQNGKRLYEVRKKGWLTQGGSAIVNGKSLTIKSTDWWSTQFNITYHNKSIGNFDIKNPPYICTLFSEDQLQLHFNIKQRGVHVLGYNQFDIFLKEQHIITFKPLEKHKHDGFQILLLEQELINIPLYLLLGILGFVCYQVASITMV